MLGALVIGHDQIILMALAYVFTGVALFGYDLSAPESERKRYVREQNLKVVLITLFAWPATVFFETLAARRLRKQYLRFPLGVFLLAGVMYLWGLLVFSLSFWLIGINWVTFIITGLAMLLASPIIAAFVMSSYPEPPDDSPAT